MTLLAIDPALVRAVAEAPARHRSPIELDDRAKRALRGGALARIERVYLPAPLAAAELE